MYNTTQFLEPVYQQSVNFNGKDYDFNYEGIYLVKTNKKNTEEVYKITNVKHVKQFKQACSRKSMENNNSYS